MSILIPFRLFRSTKTCLYLWVWVGCLTEAVIGSLTREGS